MRTKRYWVNRYNDFIKKILGGEIRRSEGIYRLLREENQNYLNWYLKDIQENSEEAKEIVIFIHINHQLNLTDPIGCCYPSIINEYESYADKIVKCFFKEDKSTFSKKLRKELSDIYSSIGSNPDKYTEVIDKVHKNIMNVLYVELLQGKEKKEVDLYEDNYWLKQFYIFINNKLVSESMKYKQKAILLQEEADLLLKEKEKNFMENEKNIKSFIHFLYINHELNLLDPTEQYYPGLIYPYEKFAWEIVEAYEGSEQEEFIKKVKCIVHSIYYYLGCDKNKRKWKIEHRIGKIQETLKSLN